MYRYIIKYIILLLCIIIFIRFCYKAIKYKSNIEGANNYIFLKPEWNNYQYFQFHINHLQDDSIENKIIDYIKRWENNYSWYSICNSELCKLIYKSDIQIKTFLELLISKPVRKYNNNIIPYFIILFPKENKMSCFLSHYYCDGQVFLDFANMCFNTNQTIHFLKYKYYPLISDLYIMKYIYSFLKTRKYSKKKLLLSEKSHICVIQKNIDHSWKRYKVYAYIFHFIFQHIDIHKLRVAFTVGIDDEHNEYNRIGIINTIITRKNTMQQYEKHIKNKISNKLKEALVSYDLVNHFPIHFLRKGLNNSVDIIFTSYRFNDVILDNSLCQFEMSSFLGSGKIPIYINSMTQQNKLIISLKISTFNFKLKKFLTLKNTSLLYTFKTQNKEVYYFRKYQKYKYKLNKKKII